MYKGQGRSQRRFLRLLGHCVWPLQVLTTHKYYEQPTKALTGASPGPPWCHLSVWTDYILSRMLACIQPTDI